jgi:cell division septum initiation protein DivIVA
MSALTRTMSASLSALGGKVGKTVALNAMIAEAATCADRMVNHGDSSIIANTLKVLEGVKGSKAASLRGALSTLRDSLKIAVCPPVDAGAIDKALGAWKAYAGNVCFPVRTVKPPPLPLIVDVTGADTAPDTAPVNQADAAAQIIEDARKQAASIIAEAREEARKIRAEASEEAAYRGRSHASSNPETHQQARRKPASGSALNPTPTCEGRRYSITHLISE